MSDVDRLRAAADALDEAVRYAGDNPGMAILAQQQAAQAALLRAVADERKSGMVVGDWDSGWKVVLKPLWVAALALADTILGDPNE